jgi:hypothetical protein
LGRRLDRQVVATYGTLAASLLPTNDRHLISQKLSRILKKDTAYEETWLCNASLALKARCKTFWEKQHEQEKTIRGMQVRMRQC